MSETAALDLTYEERIERAAKELSRWSVASRAAAVMALRRAGVPELVDELERYRAEHDALKAAADSFGLGLHLCWNILLDLGYDENRPGAYKHWVDGASKAYSKYAEYQIAKPVARPEEGEA